MNELLKRMTDRSVLALGTGSFLILLSQANTNLNTSTEVPVEPTSSPTEVIPFYPADFYNQGNLMGLDELLNSGIPYEMETSETENGLCRIIFRSNDVLGRQLAVADFDLDDPMLQELKMLEQCERYFNAPNDGLLTPSE